MFFFFFFSVDIFGKTFAIGKPVQIGSFCVPVYPGVCIPCALTLEANVVVTLKFKVKCENLNIVVILI